jgi:hypothetical protein
MRALAVLLATLTGLGMLVIRQAAVPTDASGGRQAGTASSMTGTITALRSASSAQIILLRSETGQVQTLTVTKRTRISTPDGQLLIFNDLRPGDDLRIRSAERIEDLSQRALDLHGVVASAPLLGGPITVISDRGQAILVDANGQTDYVDRSQETSGLTELVEADIVHLRGIYDSTLREMTETRSIVRLGPIPDTLQHNGTGR